MTERLGPQQAVRLRPDGEGVQFTPFGMAQLGRAEFEEGMPIAGALPAKEAPQAPQQHDSVDEYIARVKAPKTAQQNSASISPASVVKAAKSRIKELRAFLREAKKAEKELKELERLVDAAKKPLAAVRDLRRTAG